MFRYILALLFITTYSGSFVVPLPQPTDKDNGSVANALSNLAKVCENQFLSPIISSKLNECNVRVPPYDEKQFECLTFYDINSRLCKAHSISKASLLEYPNVIKQEINIEKLCDTASNWTFGNITQFSEYQNTVSSVFNTKITCVKVCGVPRVISQDTNFFCKYYKWGLSLLQEQSAALPQTSNAPLSIPAGPVIDNKNSIQRDPPVAEKHNIIPTENIDKNIPSGSAAKIIPSGSAAEIGPSGNTDKVEVHNPNEVSIVPDGTILQSQNNEGSNTPKGLKSVVSGQSPPAKKVGNSNLAEVEDQNSDLEIRMPNADKTTVSGSAPSPDLINDGMDKPEIDESKKTEMEHKGQNQNQNKLDSIEYPDSDDREELPEGADDGDGQMPPAEFNTKQDNGQANVKKIETPMSFNSEKQNHNKKHSRHFKKSKKLSTRVGSNSNEREIFTKLIRRRHKKAKKITTTTSRVLESNDNEFYPNSLQGGFADDADGHFFSFFLTSVVLVVIIYVLYHNKSKVSKVFLGLIVEGRQPGRRRNSRGHAYRRLDTLEQAMSTNSAAPPSKIIY